MLVLGRVNNCFIAFIGAVNWVLWGVWQLVDRSVHPKKRRARLRLHLDQGWPENSTLGCKKNDFRELPGNESGTFQK